MKKRVLIVTLTMITLLSSSMTTLAAPKEMPDGVVFDAEYYAQSNPDVTAVLGSDEAMLYQHYVLFGKDEGRLPVNPAEQLAIQQSQTLEELDGSDENETQSLGPGHHNPDGSYTDAGGHTFYEGDVMMQGNNITVTFGGWSPDI